MDSKTHVELARRMMRATNVDESIAIACLFPQIDRLPPTLHRLHAHTIRKAGWLTELGAGVLSGRDVELCYEATRFREEATRLESYLASFGGEFSYPSTRREMRAAIAGFVSHLWLDTFNQPVQPFAPWSIECAGQWTLWQALGDFRLELYGTPLIDEVRAAIFDNTVWSKLDQLTPDDMLGGMIRRLQILSRGAVPERFIARSLEVLAIDSDGLAAAEVFGALEQHIVRVHLELVAPRTAERDERSLGSGSKSAGRDSVHHAL